MKTFMDTIGQMFVILLFVAGVFGIITIVAIFPVDSSEPKFKTICIDGIEYFYHNANITVKIDTERLPKRCTSNPAVHVEK